ncbi:MAG: biotin attachment protein [Clostridiaceae bacterium]|jgi:biotin carboxyl carrier protein|nr:biotin attachment protein [Clostridiaceae bacterium]
MKKYVIKLNGKVYEVEMEEVTAGTSAAITEVHKSAPAAPASSTGHKIEAPMPGTIVNVAVKIGDIVKKGQVLVILEAMKMENEIVSPIDGTITSSGVTKGDTVNAGDLLVQIG